MRNVCADLAEISDILAANDNQLTLVVVMDLTASRLGKLALSLPTWDCQESGHAIGKSLKHHVNASAYARRYSLLRFTVWDPTYQVQALGEEMIRAVEGGSKFCSQGNASGIEDGLSDGGS